MPFHKSILHNRRFDVRQIAPLSNNQQDAASIAAEVSTAVVVQASKEFCCMHKPKINKFDRYRVPKLWSLSISNSLIIIIINGEIYY